MNWWGVIATVVACGLGCLLVWNWWDSRQRRKRHQELALRHLETVESNSRETSRAARENASEALNGAAKETSNDIKHDSGSLADYLNDGGS